MFRLFYFTWQNLVELDIIAPLTWSYMYIQPKPSNYYWDPLVSNNGSNYYWDPLVSNNGFTQSR